MQGISTKEVRIRHIYLQRNR